MKLQSTGACFDNIVYSLSIVAFTFICASVFGRSWEHGSGVIPDYLKPGPKNLTSINPKILINQLSQDDNPAPPDPPVDYYFGPFDECGKQSSHTNACSKLYTCRFFLVTALITAIVSYCLDRLIILKNNLGENKLHMIVGSLWILTAFFMMIALSLWSTFITKDNRKFFRKGSETHLRVLDWKHGQAYNFGWIGFTLQVICGGLFIFIGWVF